MTPAQRTTRAKLAVQTRWAGEPDPKAATEPARKGFFARFEREVDPEGILPPEERTRRAMHARKAYMTRLALRSSQARASRGNSPGCPPPPPPPPPKAVSA